MKIINKYMEQGKQMAFYRLQGFCRSLRKIMKDESGAGILEYVVVILMGLALVVVIGGILFLIVPDFVENTLQSGFDAITSLLGF